MDFPGKQKGISCQRPGHRKSLNFDQVSKQVSIKDIIPGSTGIVTIDKVGNIKVYHDD